MPPASIFVKHRQSGGKKKKGKFLLIQLFFTLPKATKTTSIFFSFMDEF